MADILTITESRDGEVGMVGGTLGWNKAQEYLEGLEICAMDELPRYETVVNLSCKLVEVLLVRRMFSFLGSRVRGC